MKKERWLSISLLLFLVLGWEWFVRAESISKLVLPAPSVIGITLWDYLRTGYFTPHIVQTLLEVVLGLIFGGFLGITLGIVMGEWEFLRRLLSPYLIASQAVPKLALAPLFMLWFGFGITPKVVITALISFFPLLENTVTVVQYVDPQKRDLFRVLGASRWQILIRLKLPAGIPSLMAGFRIATVLAVIGAVIGEFIGGSKGLGAVIIASQGMMDTPLMFSALLLLTLLGMLLYRLVIILEYKWMKPYQRREKP